MTAVLQRLFHVYFICPSVLFRFAYSDYFRAPHRVLLPYPIYTKKGYAQKRKQKEHACFQTTALQHLSSGLQEAFLTAVTLHSAYLFQTSLPRSRYIFYFLTAGISPNTAFTEPTVQRGFSHWSRAVFPMPPLRLQVFAAMFYSSAHFREFSHTKRA